MKALAEGGLDADADVVRHLDFCLGCRGCETACPSGVHYGALIEQTRGWLEENYRRSLADRLRRWIIAELFPYPARLRLALAPLRMVERVGLRGFLQGIVPPMLREWMELLPALTGTAIESSLPTAAGGRLGSVAVHRRMRGAGGSRLRQSQRREPASSGRLQGCHTVSNSMLRCLGPAQRQSYTCV